MEMSKSVVVTGGCGFVGLNVGKKLCSLGYQVHLVDLTEPRENLITLGITFSKADICNQKQVRWESISSLTHYFIRKYN